MRHIQKFTKYDIVKEVWSGDYHPKPKIDISSDMLNKFGEEDLNRIVICSNDGQGDHISYTYKEIVDLMFNSEYPKGNGPTEDSSTSDIIDLFYEEFDLNGNNTDALYFDGEYKIISWKS